MSAPRAPTQPPHVQPQLVQGQNHPAGISAATRLHKAIVDSRERSGGSFLPLLPHETRFATPGAGTTSLQLHPEAWKRLRTHILKSSFKYIITKSSTKTISSIMGATFLNSNEGESMGNIILSTFKSRVGFHEPFFPSCGQAPPGCC